ncbi:MAG: HD domain-containing protein [Armatimonadetes bacterium]|nr:HD domain-containing protein [Armatimonadota bacterium]
MKSPKGISMLVARAYFVLGVGLIFALRVSQSGFSGDWVGRTISMVSESEFWIQSAQATLIIIFSALLLYFVTNRVLDRVFRAHQQVVQNQLEIVQRLAAAAEMRDGATYDHCYRVGRFAEEIALHLGVTKDSARLLFLASQLHDVGKIAIPDAILHKPGRLEPHERKLMEGHVELGAAMLAGVSTPMLKLAEVIVWTHHEKFDGTGYPRRLKGAEIPLEGRIVAVADVFDALVMDRPYKMGMPIERAVDIIQKDAGTHFDPEVVNAFMRALPRIRMINGGAGEYAGNSVLNMREDEALKLIKQHPFDKAA